MNDIPGLAAAEVAAQGTPWQLGVRCDGPGCDANLEGDFLVAEDSTRSERLMVVLDHAERHGWRVEWHQPAADSVTYCPACARTGVGS